MIILWRRHSMGTFSILLALWEGSPVVKVGYSSRRTGNVELKARATVEKTVQLSVIWDSMTFFWRHCNALYCFSSHVAGYKTKCVLILWGWDQENATTMQTIFSNSFSCVKIVAFSNKSQVFPVSEIDKKAAFAQYGLIHWCTYAPLASRITTFSCGYGI